MAEDRETIEREFDEVVNMRPKELEEWLETDESKSVGQKDDGGESVGHESGRSIVALLRKSRDEYTDEDHEHMRKVVGYVRRHAAQGPRKGDVEDSAWRHSLMNWGHDPLK
jgi:hypothetical protein